jgi:hypothetical protein
MADADRCDSTPLPEAEPPMAASLSKTDETRWCSRMMWACADGTEGAAKRD